MNRLRHIGKPLDDALSEMIKASGGNIKFYSMPSIYIVFPTVCFIVSLLLVAWWLIAP